MAKFKHRMASAAIGFAALAVMSAPTAQAGQRTGGAAALAMPAVQTVECVAPCAPADRVVGGAQVRVLGNGLQRVRRVVFRGGRSRFDDISAKVTHAGPRHLDTSVPRRARSGPVEVVAPGGLRARAPEALQVARPAATPTAPSGDHVFPIRGPHDLGQTATNNFGGGRGHQGQDLFAKCGTPLVSAGGGRVRMAVAGHARAGNYVVIRGDGTGLDYVYMHMRSAPFVRRDDRVTAGQPIGEVGDTGNAHGCHLHFELWTAPGWQTGGTAIDPLPRLRVWRAAR